MGANLNRRLGTFERFLWLTDQWTPRHFVVTARVEGELSPTQLESALAQAQRRHPALRVAISTDGDGAPRFSNTNSVVPLRLVDRDDSNRWLNEARAELAAAFRSEFGPLLRCVAVRGRRISEIILAVHHAIGDGLSATYLLRDLLQAMQGNELISLPPRRSLEELITAGSVLPSVPPLGPNSASKLQRPGRAMISTFMIERKQAERILARCRQEQTTLQGVLMAAAMLSLDRPVIRCLAPISLRQPYLPIEDDFGLFITSGMADLADQRAVDIWPVARRSRAQLNKAFEPRSVRSRLAALSALLAANPNPQSAYEAYRHGVSFDVVLSNLGIFSVGDSMAHLRVVALYLVLNVELEPAIAVATADGQIFESVTFDATAGIEWFGQFENLLRSAATPALH
jgi:Condensation domain